MMNMIMKRILRSWEKAEKVFEKADSVKEDGKWKIENGKIGTGSYMVEISTKDKNGRRSKRYTIHRAI
jgi:hypothetical protein